MPERLQQQRLVIAAALACVALCILNLLVFFLMAGEHSVVDYLFGRSLWSLAEDGQEQVFIALLNFLVIFAFASFFWTQDIPSTDDVGKAILHVVASACLVALALAFSRVGIFSRTVFSATVIWSVASLVFSRWFVFWIRPYVLVDCSSKMRRVVMEEGRTDIEILEIPLTEIRNLNLSSTLADGVIVGGKSSLAKEGLESYLVSGLKLFSYSEFLEKTLGKVEIDSDPQLENYVFITRNGYLIVRRVIDIFVALIVIPTSAPILLILGLLMKMQHPGPVFFEQERVGRGGLTFTLYKLRTMKSEKLAHSTFASQNAHRLTRLGRVIRRWRVDELPQFLNILKGDMTIVGPRPEQVDFVRLYESKIPFYRLRHVVRPGLTGWAQVKQGYAEGEEETREKLGYDIYYIKNVSVWLDLLVTIKTFHFMMRGR